MRFIILFFLFLLACSSPKKVFICGDRECIDKKEAEEYFAKNLSIEVKIIEKKSKKEISLIEENLNIKPKKVVLLNKENDFKKPTQEQIKIKKKERKERLRVKSKKKKEKNKLFTKILKDKPKKEISSKEITTTYKVNKDEICDFLDKCDMDEISNFLINKGESKNYPNINQ